MERCPNCDTPSRPGAKFCTTCGYRFNADNDDEPPVEPSVMETRTEGIDSPPENDEPLANWPTPPSADVPNDDSFWAPDRTETTSTDQIDGPTILTSWQEEAPPPWPAPPPESGGNDASEPAPVVIAASESLVLTESPKADVETNRAQAERLLDELRQVINAMDDATEANFSGVVSDLEVALAPPGALSGEGLNELREALLSARERPRDVDTIVDLTRRVDAIVALMFAYDRTIAAIERSLEVLRRLESTTNTEPD